jgi:Na+-transporting methylmalonyl-CoA/oxaloacetate decarboxylase gamma subunit
MMKRLLTVSILILAAASLQAQNVIDLIISEVMVDNTSSVVDDFGERTPWVEVFNTSQGTVNIAGCFFTDDPSDLTKSPIVKGDLRTKIGPRQVAVFFADGQSSKGTFYLNFPLREGSTLYLVSNDGRTVIDSIEIPAGIPEGQSISKFATDRKEMVFDDVHAAVPSPLSVNGRHNQKTKAQIVKENDPHGYTLTIVSISVVFLALLILFTIYNFSGKVFSGQIKFRNPFKRGARAAGAASLPAGGSDDEIALAIAMALHSECGGETEAAIALALHRFLSESMHDAEPFIITVQPRSSAWNDRTRNFRKQPR